MRIVGIPFFYKLEVTHITNNNNDDMQLLANIVTEKIRIQ
jgi:hypothetical protein